MKNADQIFNWIKFQIIICLSAGLRQGVRKARGAHQNHESERVACCLLFQSILLQECLADNDRDWRKCQKGVLCSITLCTRVMDGASSSIQPPPLQRSRPGGSASKRGSREGRCEGKGMQVPQLYRAILKAAKQFPSIKRERILEDIRIEFHENKVRHLVSLI